jgi:G3E family GTPase
MDKAAVIINEFGEIALDHILVTAPREDVVLLPSGCLCCSLRGDLVQTLTSLYSERARGEIPPFDRVLVETTGLADPAPVLLTVTADPELSRVFHVERVITTVDAVHGFDQLDSHPESVKQACVADAILLTKTDLADADTVAALRARVHRLNPIAHIREVRHGEIDADWLFNLAAPGSARTRDFSDLVEQAHGAAKHDHHDHHDHNDQMSDAHADIRSFAVIREDKVTFPGLQVWMGLLGDVRGPNLLRVKGIVNVDGHPIVIQAVQHMFHPLRELPDWPDDDRRSRIVFITRNLSRQEIERTLDALSLDIAPSAQGSSINPEAFRKFVAAASRFR